MLQENHKSQLTREKREEILTVLVKIYCEQEGLKLEDLEFEETKAGHGKTA